MPEHIFSRLMLSSVTNYLEGRGGGGIHIRLAYLAPSVKMHAAKLGRCRLGHVDVERLTLAYVSATICSHIDQSLRKGGGGKNVQGRDCIWNKTDFLLVDFSRPLLEPSEKSPTRSCRGP